MQWKDVESSIFHLFYVSDAWGGLFSYKIAWVNFFNIISKLLLWGFFLKLCGLFFFLILLCSKSFDLFYKYLKIKLIWYMKILTGHRLQELQGTWHKLDLDMFSYNNVFLLLSAEEKNILVSLCCWNCNIKIFECVKGLLSTIPCEQSM